MKITAKRLFAKLLVIPAVFSFAVACCQPVFAQVSESHEDVAQTQLQEIVTSNTLSVEEGHHCDHGHHEQAAVRAPEQRLITDILSDGLSLAFVPSYQYSIIEPQVLTIPRITGPPWDGKSIKAFLGVYRS